MTAAVRQMTAWMNNPDNMDVSNIIHSTGGGQAYGFKGALITGSIVYGWCVPAILDAIGDRWLHDGWARVRFRRPVYPGDAIRVSVSPAVDGIWTLEVIRGEDEIALAAQLGVGAQPADLLPGFVESPAAAPVPQPDPAPVLRLEEAPVGGQLSTLATSLRQPAVAPEAMITKDTLAGLVVGGIAYANPAGVSGRMSWYGHAQYNYGGPSIHTTTEVKYFRAALVGEPLHIASVVKDAFDRNGDHYIVYDGTIRGVQGDRIAFARHTTIFHVAPRVK